MLILCQRSRLLFEREGTTFESTVRSPRISILFLWEMTGVLMVSFDGHCSRFGTVDLEGTLLEETLLDLVEDSGCESMGVTLGLIYVLFACFRDVSFVLVVCG